MLKSIFLISLFLCLQNVVLGQELSTKFSKISKVDLEFSPSDNKAEAVTLFDQESISFIPSSDGGFGLKIIRKRRVKILKEEGVKYSNVEFLLKKSAKGEIEKLTDLEGFTYNLSEKGKVVKTKLDNTQVYDENLSRGTKKKFTFPSVKVGSVIEYKYTIISPFVFNLLEWAFQEKIPVIYNELDIKLNPIFEYILTTQNIKKFTEKTATILNDQKLYYGIKYKEQQHTFVMKDVPALRDESYITSRDDYLMKINFQLKKYYQANGNEVEILSTWEKFIKTSLSSEKFGKYIDKSKKLSKEIYEQNPSLLEGSDIDKAKKIITYVKNNYTWNEKYGRYTSRSVKAVSASKSGSVAEINLLLIGMLKEAGIDAHPMILSSRGNGKIYTKYPFDHYFNYVIPFIKVGHRIIFADATTPYTAYNELPLRCINDKGVVLKESGEFWLDIYNSTKTSENYQITLKPDNTSKTMKISLKNSFQGTEATLMKEKYHNHPKKLEKYYRRCGFNEINHLETYAFDNPDSIYSIDFDTKLEIGHINGSLIVKPFLHLSSFMNPFKEDERSYDVDLRYKLSKSIEVTLLIPEGYALSSLPENIEINNHIISIISKNEEKDNQLKLQFDYAFKKREYSSKDYQELKKAFDILIDKLNIDLVLEPIEN